MKVLIALAVLVGLLIILTPLLFVGMMAYVLNDLDRQYRVERF